MSTVNKSPAVIKCKGKTSSRLIYKLPVLRLSTKLFLCSRCCMGPRRATGNGGGGCGSAQGDGDPS